MDNKEPYTVMEGSPDGAALVGRFSDREKAAACANSKQQKVNEDHASKEPQFRLPFRYIVFFQGRAIYRTKYAPENFAKAVSS
jgi:hypothetical protein